MPLMMTKMIAQSAAAPEHVRTARQAGAARLMVPAATRLGQPPRAARLPPSLPPSQSQLALQPCARWYPSAYLAGSTPSSSSMASAWCQAVRCCGAFWCAGFWVLRSSLDSLFKERRRGSTTVAPACATYHAHIMLSAVHYRTACVTHVSAQLPTSPSPFLNNRCRSYCGSQQLQSSLGCPMSACRGYRAR